MKRVFISALLVSATLSVLAQSDPANPAPAASSPAKKLDLYVLTEETVDLNIPVITMEQHYSGQTRLQGYRIQIFKNGSGVYHGLKNVKTLGEVRFNFKPEQVQKILDEFERFKFWRVPEDQYGVPAIHAPLALTFTLRDKTKTKTVRFSGQNHGGMLLKVIDDEVYSSRWRCPYTDDRELELCASRDRYATYSIPDFLKLDLPKLLEEYK